MRLSIVPSRFHHTRSHRAYPRPRQQRRPSPGVLKKKLQQEGIVREMRLREHFEKPSEKRAREKAEGIRRARKLAQKKLNRELGLGPAKKSKPSRSK
jgi:small subunit ribosomal protein S21